MLKVFYIRLLELRFYNITGIRFFPSSIGTYLIFMIYEDIKKISNTNSIIQFYTRIKNKREILFQTIYFAFLKKKFYHNFGGLNRFY